jgi:hypothetical protein
MTPAPTLERIFVSTCAYYLLIKRDCQALHGLVEKTHESVRRCRFPHLKKSQLQVAPCPCEPLLVSHLGPEVGPCTHQARISVFCPAGNIHPSVYECKVQSRFQCWVLPRTTEGVSLTCPEGRVVHSRCLRLPVAFPLTPNLESLTPDTWHLLLLGVVHATQEVLEARVRVQDIK